MYLRWLIDELKKIEDDDLKNVLQWKFLQKSEGRPIQANNLLTEDSLNLNSTTLLLLLYWQYYIQIFHKNTQLNINYWEDVRVPDTFRQGETITKDTALKTLYNVWCKQLLET